MKTSFDNVMFKNRILFTFCISILFFSCGSKKSGNDIVIILNHNNGSIKNLYARNMFDNGIDEMQKHNINNALEYFLKANDSFPNCPDILNVIGASYAEFGATDSCFRYFEKSLTIDSNVVETYVDYGTALNLAKYYGDARYILNRGLNLKNISNFNKCILYTNIASSYMGLADYDKAQNSLDSACGFTSDSSMHQRILSFKRKVFDSQIKNGFEADSVKEEGDFDYIDKSSFKYEEANIKVGDTVVVLSFTRGNKICGSDARYYSQYIVIQKSTKDTIRILGACESYVLKGRDSIGIYEGIEDFGLENVSKDNEYIVFDRMKAKLEKRYYKTTEGAIGRKE